MSELLQRIHGEIRARRRASEAAAQEYERLQMALAALDQVAGAAASRSEAARTRDAVANAPVNSAASRRLAAKRAPRGANREAVLRVVGERPGVTVNELATAAGVKTPVLYALLGRLVEQGKLVKEPLPGGSTGYTLPRASTTSTASVLGDGEDATAA